MVSVQTKIKKDGSYLKINELPELKCYEEVLPNKKVFRVFRKENCKNNQFCKCISDLWNQIILEHNLHRKNTWRLEQIIFENGDGLIFNKDYFQWDFSYKKIDDINLIIIKSSHSRFSRDVENWFWLSAFSDDNDTNISYILPIENIRMMTFTLQ